MDTDRHKGPLTAKVTEWRENKRNKLYQEKLWAMRRDFIPFFYMVYGMAGRDPREAEKRLDTLLAEKWQREYSKMVEFVKVKMSLSVVRSNALLLRGHWGNQGLI